MISTDHFWLLSCAPTGNPVWCPSGSEADHSCKLFLTTISFQNISRFHVCHLHLHSKIRSLDSRLDWVLRTPKLKVWKWNQCISSAGGHAPSRPPRLGRGGARGSSLCRSPRRSGRRCCRRCPRRWSQVKCSMTYHCYQILGCKESIQSKSK